MDIFFILWPTYLLRKFGQIWKKVGTLIRLLDFLKISTYRINIYWPIYSISHNKLCTLFWNCRFLKFWNSVKLNIDILNWYLIKGMPSKKKLWTFPKSKLGFQNNNFGPKNHQNFLKNSMDIHGWPTYLLKICPNFFSGKNMASTDPTYLWFGICPKFRSFFFFEGLPKENTVSLTKTICL